ncbi:MAG: NAD(+) diphosphatase [Acidobacteriota bacterium]
MSMVHVFAGSTLDRRGNARRDPSWFEEAYERGRYLVVWESQALITANGPGAPRALSSSEAQAHLADETARRSLVFLGVDRQDTPYFAFDVSHLSEDPPQLVHDGEFADLRQVASIVEGEDAARMAYARAMMRWHRQHRYCGVCGDENEVRNSGHSMRCESCGADHFPRTDPAVIMLVHDGEGRCLLGRQASWPPGVLSTLAGFVEPGESLEEAVIREVWEETGIEVHEARYHSSQPWPFPSSIMLGFHARGTFAEPKVDQVELEQAVWLERGQLLELQARREVRFPPPMSIARQLLEAWLAETNR